MIHDASTGFTHSGATDNQQNYWWVFALVLIFLALIFLRDKEKHHNTHHPMEAVLPAMVMNGQNHRPHNHDNGDRERWDIMRDSQAEFSNVRREIAETAWRQSAESAKYFYEDRAATDRAAFEQARITDRGFFDQAIIAKNAEIQTGLGFKDAAILGLQNKGEIIGRIDALEKRIAEDTMRKQGEEINYLKTVMALQPRPIQPSFPVAPPSHVSFGC